MNNKEYPRKSWRIIHLVVELLSFVICPLLLWGMLSIDTMTNKTFTHMGMLISLRYSWPLIPLYLWTMLAHFVLNFFSPNSYLSEAFKRVGHLVGVGLSFVAIFILFGLDPFFIIPFVIGALTLVFVKAIWYFFSIERRWSSAFTVKETLFFIAVFIILTGGFISLIAGFKNAGEYLVVIPLIAFLIYLCTIPGSFFLKSLTKYVRMLTKESPFALIKGVPHIRTNTFLIVILDLIVVSVMILLLVSISLKLSNDVYEALEPYQYWD